MTRGNLSFSKLTRREFLRTSALAATGGLLTASQGALRPLTAAFSSSLAAQAADSPNVLVIVMDTLRYDRFAPSMPSSLTPNLDRIAANGVRFENAWANSSWSLPAQASILTGRYPHEHGADWPKLDLRNEYPTLGEYFSSRGYVTGAFSSNSAWITPEYLGRGFLRFNVYNLADHLRRTGNGRKVDRLLWEFGFHYSGYGNKAPKINTQFLRFLDDYQDHPYFAYICYMDVNQRYHHKKLNHPFWQERPPVKDIMDTYDQALTLLDSQIADLFTEMEKRGALQNTLVIITSDHGESFGAAGTEDHDPEGHGTSLYPEQTKVPLFVYYPEHVPAGQTINRLVGIEAIPATIAHILGLDDAPFLGEPLPLTEEVEKGLPDDEARVLTTLNYADNVIQSVLWKQWMYLKFLSAPDRGEELYDLEADPLAKINLAADFTAVAPMRERLQQLLATR